jgi:endonuclease/exonuclease/phosphatase family metal-dependent hydrolase
LSEANEGCEVNIKVMTYNIHHGKGMDKKVDLKRISEVISSSNADIIGLNEVDKHFSKRSHYMDQVQFLAKELNLYYAFSPSLTIKSKKNMNVIHQYGNGVLSRFPLISSNHYLFDFLPGIIEGRSFLESTIEINRKVVNLYVTHLSLHPYLHKIQSEFILENSKKPAIILGDWNMKPKSRKWKKVTERYNDVWEAGGKKSGFTYPSTYPRIRLDYIFVSKDIQILDTKVIDTLPMASDHLPIIATLSMGGINSLINI